MRGATSPFPARRSSNGFNSRPSCEGRLASAVALGTDGVSIHAPHARGDRIVDLLHEQFVFQFTPLMRGATWTMQIGAGCVRFQFTPLMRGATRRTVATMSMSRFNSRPSCEGRPVERVRDGTRKCFNSRPSCEGRPPLRQLRPGPLFQFTPLMRGATERGASFRSHGVSIHAPHARGDRRAPCWRRPRGFNSRPSCEGRPSRTRASTVRHGFNSRPSCEGRLSSPVHVPFKSVSIHAPHARGDC